MRYIDTQTGRLCEYGATVLEDDAIPGIAKVVRFMVDHGGGCHALTDDRTEWYADGRSMRLHFDRVVR